MDRLERVDDQVVAMQKFLRGWQTRIWTSLPGILESYDATKITCVVQAAIQARTRTPNGKWENRTLPLLLDVPVQFPRGGGYGFSFPLEKGNEGIVLFSSRCIDAWWQSGGVQPQAEFRMHDLSDGMFIPGISSVPNVPSDVSATAARMWAEDGSMMYELDKTTGIATVKAPTQFVVDSPITHLRGAVAIDGVVSQAVGGGGTIDFGNTNIETTGSIRQGGIELGTHRHTNVQPGSGDSGGPTP